MKLHSQLAGYLIGIEAALGALRGADIELYVEEAMTPRRANLRIRIRFADGRILAINEAVVVNDDTLVHLDYRYHCQRPDNTLLFRYDSTPHFPDLPGFPEHKHLPGKVVSSARPSLQQVLVEAGEATAGTDPRPERLARLFALLDSAPLPDGFLQERQNPPQMSRDPFEDRS
jgi:hypothetical protein